MASTTGRRRRGRTVRVCAVVFTSGAVALHAVLQFAFQILRLNNLFVCLLLGLSCVPGGGGELLEDRLRPSFFSYILT